MLKYTGNGFMPGVPARDLTEDEVKQYGRARLLRTGLYSEVSRRTKPVVAELDLLDKEQDHGIRY